MYGTGRGLTHTDPDGRASMVDVSDKPPTTREAVAVGWIELGPESFRLVKENGFAKGDVLTVAQIAGINGAKHTGFLVPLCHPLTLDHVKVELDLDEAVHGVRVRASAKTTGPTGVEMEALTAASVALLTVYDMCKAVTHDMTIREVGLEEKTGGQRGDFKRT